MKKTITSFFAVATMALLTACSSQLYQQIATLSSENVKLHDDGAFMYVNPDLTIEYKFWSESGKFNFRVTNNTADNIYLNLEESFFIDNGIAHDYYQARTFGMSSKDRTIHGGTYYGISTIISPIIINDTYTGEDEVYVEYAEQPRVCIPAGSSKVFDEFAVSDAVYRTCGFPRDPSSKEDATLSYEEATSPKVIENRLIFIIDGVKVPVNNVFYVSEYRNIARDDAEEDVRMERCSGSKYYVKVNKFGANNKFYITYSEDDMEEVSDYGDDRTKSSHRWVNL